MLPPRDAPQRHAAATCRLRAWINRQLNTVRKDDMRRGLPVRKLQRERARKRRDSRRIASFFAETRDRCVLPDAAINAGELAPNADAQELAGFIVSSLQGAILVQRAQRIPIPWSGSSVCSFSTTVPGREAIEAACRAAH